MSRSKLLNKKKQSNFKIKNNASDLRCNINGGVFNYVRYTFIRQKFVITRRLIPRLFLILSFHDRSLIYYFICMLDTKEKK